MRTIRTMVTILMAILWLPVSAHCRLVEFDASLDFLSCCAHEEAQSPPADPPENNCADDACAIVETAKYKSSSQRVTVPPLDTRVLFELPPLLEMPLTHAAIGARQVEATLACLPASWQFVSRAALPPRAPSPLA